MLSVASHLAAFSRRSRSKCISIQSIGACLQSATKRPERKEERRERWRTRQAEMVEIEDGLQRDQEETRHLVADLDDEVALSDGVALRDDDALDVTRDGRGDDGFHL